MNNKSKLASLTKSVENLKSVLTEIETQIVRDAAIKRYELCYELAWKSVQEALKVEGLEICKSPKNCFKEAFKQGWIVDEEIWAEMIQNRNLTTHTYNEDLAIEIYNNLRKYLLLFEYLLVQLQTQ
ncbi:MAG: HI0074 family nucleotidyltransferase substrate-binding subunit [Thiomargarita sp.]|nr:HI0074 family nucleotidyltransferase substrate-binding subunit [Thiomargarita sp.]